ncbi:MAG: hypothetical protein GY696_34440 [Gammaproteobacteria bacterium]|nr:hypothetical protein [Gammaproteobacteria bacterium]
MAVSHNRTHFELGWPEGLGFLVRGCGSGQVAKARQGLPKPPVLLCQGRASTARGATPDGGIPWESHK